MAHIAVQRVGEVDRRRPLRKIDHPALRREHVNGVIQRRLPGLRGPVGGVDHVVAPGQHLAQEGDLVVEAIAAATLAAWTLAT